MGRSPEGPLGEVVSPLLGFLKASLARKARDQPADVRCQSQACMHVFPCSWAQKISQ